MHGTTLAGCAALAAGLVALVARSVAGEEPAPPRTPDVWAVVVGIDQYEDKTIPPGSGAVRDAREIHRWFLEAAGWDRRHVLLMNDSGLTEPVAAKEQLTDLKPTRKNLAWAFKEWLGSRVKPGDVSVLFFAGRSVGMPPPPGSPPGTAGREFLLPIDTRASDPQQTGWSLEDALDPLAAQGQFTIACWLDTSLQGRGKKGVAIPGADLKASGLRWLNKLARWPGVTAWLAADGQPAAEAPDLSRRSAFTDALLTALGSARRPNNLLACLDRLNRDQSLLHQGFRTSGGIAPEQTLWSQVVRARSAPERTLLLQRGHADRVEAVAFTADGARMVTASWDSTVKIWRVADRTLLRTLPGYFHLAGVSGLALSPSGEWLASGDGDGAVRVWNLVENTEKSLLGPPPHTSRILNLAFLPDGTHFVSADQEGKSWLWDLSGKQLSAKPLASGLTALETAILPGPVSLALAVENGPIRLLGDEGSPLRTLPGPGGTVTSLALSADGGLVAAGDEDGRVLVWDVTNDKPIYQHEFDGEVGLLGLSSARSLAVGTAEALYLASLDGAGPTQKVAVPGQVHHAVFSPDARWLAACTKRTGSVHLWRVDDPAAPQAVPLSGAEKSLPAAVSIAFAPNAKLFVSGDQDGGIRSWSLPDGEPKPAIPPRRGKVASLSVSADSRYLFQITRDWTALLWDLKEGRGFTSVDGMWTSGAIAPDATSLILTSYQTGDVVVVDRASGLPRATKFARPPARGNPGLVTRRFGANNVVDGDQMVRVSRDGLWVTACSSEGPLACVWETKTGRLVHAVLDPDHQEPVTAVDLTRDAHQWLTADSGGTARLWDITGAEMRPREVATFQMPGEAITAARINPSAPRKVATGTRSGRVFLCEAGNVRPVSMPVRLRSAVRTLTFSTDGRWLAVGGADKSVRLLPMDRAGETVRPDIKHPHAEQVNTLLAWPDGGMIVSGSDDTTVRFWDLKSQALLGTLSAVQETTEKRAGGGAAGATIGPFLDSSWVAYTPDEGLFDSSPGGERQVTWLRDSDVLPLEQFYDSCHVFGLCDWLRQGKQPPSPTIPRDPPPHLAIDQPAQATLRGANRNVELTISLSQPDLTNLRLYQDGVPVQGEADFDLKTGQRQLNTQLALHSGVNRFYAMGSRAGSIDGRSNEVEVRYDGPDNPGQLHVLALGISRYPNRALQFAHQDAQQIAEFLSQHSVYKTGQEIRPLVLTDEEVTNENVEKALREIQRRVRGRPQDTVAVFLAGHTDVRQNRFCLLLSSYAFPDGPALVASRGPKAGTASTVADDPETVLPYAKLYLNLARYNALQRLIIIDACQSEAVFDDPAVQLIRRHIDDGAQRARTSYILAARRGEPATEVAALRHGLLTYVLLRGMGAPGLDAVPNVLAFDIWPNADMDKDGVVSTEELRKYASLTLPSLASKFPEVVQRAGAGPVRPTANLNQDPRLQAIGGHSFPLVELPRQDTRPAR